MKEKFILSGTKDNVFYTKKTLNIQGNLLHISKPLLMGILNITPDSFYEDSRVGTEQHLLSKAEQMLSEGATFLDMGAYSSRPGAANVSEEEEIARLLPAVKLIKKNYPQAVISVDTFRSEVARLAVSEGAALINDISGGSLDEQMYDTAAALAVPYIVMHMRGTPSTMTKLTEYENLEEDLLLYFSEKISLLKSKGVKDIIVDPGLGFAKTIDQNYGLLNHLEILKILNKPLLIGLSRKSMIYKTLKTGPEEALNGTTVLNTIAVLKGADILRVHDVKAAHEAVELIERYKKNI